jgi:hypothetical protein
MFPDVCSGVSNRNTGWVRRLPCSYSVSSSWHLFCPSLTTSVWIFHLIVKQANEKLLLVCVMSHEIVCSFFSFSQFRPGSRLGQSHFSPLRPSRPFHRHALAVAIVSHTHSLKKHPLPPLGSGVTQGPPLSTFCAWNWGPQPKPAVSSNGRAEVGDESTRRCVLRRQWTKFL